MSENKFVGSARFDEIRNQLGAMDYDLQQAFERELERYYELKKSKGRCRETEEAFEDMMFHASLYLNVIAAHGDCFSLENASNWREIEREIEEGQS